MALSDLINLSGRMDDVKRFAFVRQRRWPNGVAALCAAATPELCPKRFCCKLRDGVGTMQDRGRWLRRWCCCPSVVVGGPEAGVVTAEGVLERVVQHRCAHIEEGLHRRPVPTHLLLLRHAPGDDLWD